MKPVLKSKRFYTDDESMVDIYRMNQIVRHNLKADKVRDVSYYVSVALAMLPHINQGGRLSMICMGTRNNNERDTLYHQLTGNGVNVGVASVDIAPSSQADFVFDFNECPIDWTGKWDILFSNSIDHAVDPSATFYEWLRIIKPGGLFVLQVNFDTDASDSDCSAFTKEDFDAFAISTNEHFVLEHADRDARIYVFRKTLTVNYFLPDMTCLRYFMPLILSGNKRGYRANVFYGRTDKYNNPQSYTDLLKSLATQHGFSLYQYGDAAEHPANISFMVEGQGLQYATGKKVSLTYMRDFNELYSGYIQSVDHVIFPSRFMAEHYGKLSEKNLYIGSPKYDVKLDREEIKRRYGLDGRWALFMFPRLRDMSKMPFDKIFSCLRECGLKVLVKTRGKDPVPDHLCGDRKYSDYQWWPHSTMELIMACDVVINSSSTTIKECVMLNRNVINFDVKPFHKHMDYLYGYPFVHELPLDIDHDTLVRAIKTKSESDYAEDFKRAREIHLFEAEGTCDRIWAALT
jgi:SAM-dependent methyltransferase